MQAFQQGIERLIELGIGVGGRNDGAQTRQIGGLFPERQVGLRGDVIGAAENIEVVDIGRAEISLDRVGHALDRHAELLRLDAVDVDEDLVAGDMILVMMGVQYLRDLRNLRFNIGFSNPWKIARPSVAAGRFIECGDFLLVNKLVYGAEVPFMRPAELSADATGSVDSAAHAVEWLAAHAFGGG